jgi:large subunit ribosomal protein L20
MARVKRGVTAKARHRKILGKAKGYYNARRKVFRVAKQAVIKAGQYAFRDRRVRKPPSRTRRTFRADIVIILSMRVAPPCLVPPGAIVAQLTGAGLAMWKAVSVVRLAGTDDQARSLKRFL